MNTIIEKIRAEVKRRRDLHYKYYVKHGRGSSAESRYDEDVELLSFLDTLESEKPTTAEGLEDEIERWFEEIDKYTPFNFTDIGNTARHFAKWQKERDEKELSEKIALVKGINELLRSVKED